MKKFLAYAWFVSVAGLALWAGEHYDKPFFKFCGGVLASICVWYVTIRAMGVIRGDV